MAISPNYFFNTPWPGVAVWCVLYISDYYLTLTCARLYRAGVSDKIAFEGSFEITPYFQRDIDSLKALSRRFLAALLWGGALLAMVWKLSLLSQPVLYQLCLGAMISSELAVHVRHFRNLALFRMMAGSDAVRGRIEYTRSAILQMSVVELLAFAGLFLVIFVFTQSWFLLGGAIACLSIAWKHRKLAHAHVAGVAVQAAHK